MQSILQKQGGKRGCLAVIAALFVLLSILLIPIPASAAEGTLPGQYPPVYPLRRPSYSSSSFPLKRPPLGTVKLALAEHIGGMLKSDGTIEWLASTNATELKINPGNVVDFAVGFEYSAGKNATRYQSCVIALDKNGKVYAATLSTDKSVVNAINAANSAWQQGDIVQVQCGGGHFVGLKKDGTVIATGRSNNGQLTGINGVTGVVKIAAQETATMLLKYDGTVIATGGNTCPGATAYPAAVLTSWKQTTSNPIVDVSIERHNLAVLRADGTVEVASSMAAYGSITSWKQQDIVQLASVDSGIIGLKSNGSVIAASATYLNRCVTHTVSATSAKAFQVVGGFCASAALMNDGTIKAVGGDPTLADKAFSSDIATQFPKVDYRPYVISSLATGVSYTAPQTVELSGNHDLYQTIYYTTDGTDPQTSSTRKLYTSPIAINGDVTIRAVPYSTSESAYGMVCDFPYTFTYPAIVPSKQSGAFLNAFKLTATAGTCTIRYTTANRDVQPTDPALPSQGLQIDKTTTVRLAADFGGRLVSPLELTYTKTDVGVMAAKDSLKLQFRASSSGAWSDTPVWAQGAQVQASVNIEKIVDEPLSAVLVLLVEDTSGGGVRTVARKVSFVNVTTSGQAETALLTLPEGASGALRAKAFLLDGFARLRPVSVIVMK